MNTVIEPRATRKGRWYQFTLATPLLFMLVWAIACSFVATALRRARKREEAVASIQAAGGTVDYDYEVDAEGVHIPNAKPPGPACLRRLFGENTFAHVRFVFLPGPDVVRLLR